MCTVHFCKGNVREGMNGVPEVAGVDGGVVAEARHQRYPLQVTLTIKHNLFRDGILGHQLNQRLESFAPC
jgi:hypothetical protein